MNGQKCEACGNTALVEKNGKLLCESCGNVQEIQNEEKSEIEVLLDEAFESLLYKDWDKADKICDKVLKVDKNCSRAYLGKLLAETQCQKQCELKKLREPFDESKNYKAIQKLEDTELIDALAKDNATIIEINSNFGFTKSASPKTKKSIKGFAITSGVLFILSSITILSTILRIPLYIIPQTEMIRYVIPQTVIGIVLFLLSIFVFKRKKGAITVMWAMLTITELLSVLSSGYFYIPAIIMIVVFALLTLLNAFQKSLLKKKTLRFIIFVIPLLYGFFGIVGGYSIYELAQTAFCFLAMIFYLFMLINCNKVSKYKKEK